MNLSHEGYPSYRKNNQTLYRKDSIGILDQSTITFRGKSS
jgi:hypothetical protein